ncbi:MAG: NAD(P)/FAD-dependent oxidoreductase [Pseudomonadales bacterium]|nr:NAD(P)/FAD-dependent oxidoreductase [Pseudomonadales bacterium]
MTESTQPDTPDTDVIVVGAGFAGLYMVHSLRTRGFAVEGIEAAGNVGGTWYWNRYPGARCDVDSLDYQYAFSDSLQRGWSWTERYATQPEILRYLEYVADALDLRREFRFSTRVTAANFDADRLLWRVTTDDGTTRTARFCVLAVGCLSVTQVPDFPGLGDFTGAWYHTGNWPHEHVDFHGKRVGIIGTGSSGVQAIPLLAAQAEELWVFQRSPNFSVPARNATLPAEAVDAYKDRFLATRAEAIRSDFGNSTWRSLPSALAAPADERTREYESRWEFGGAGFMVTYSDLMIDKAANDTAADFIRGKIRAIVKDPTTAGLLSPTDHPIGAKRICVDTNYYATFNRPNVHLVDVRSQPIKCITANGVRTEATDYPLDCLVFATGFDAMTGPLTRIDIRGRNGRSLRDLWRDGPACYLGLMIADFPNLFTITGPGSPSVLSNMVISIEQHVDWITDCLQALRTRQARIIEADLDAQTEWMAHVQEAAAQTLFPEGNSWYVGANIPGKPRVFMPYTGGVRAYREKCDAVAASDYEGFRVS